MIMTLGEPVQLTKDKPFDIWFGLPPITLSQGFTLFMVFEGGSISKTTDKAVTITRATIKNYSVVDLNQIIEDEEAELAAEREALIALYNATDGPHWNNNTNWCSDRPLSEWYGVTTDPTGRVQKLELNWNGLDGALPDEITSLKAMTTLSLIESVGIVTNLDPIFDLTQLEYLEFGIGERVWVKPKLFAVSPKIGRLKNLKRLRITGSNADLPEELFDLEQLENLVLTFSRMVLGG